MTYLSSCLAAFNLQSWSSLSLLTWLGLTTNRLNGTLPQEWAGMALHSVFLDDNAFSGRLPQGPWLTGLVNLNMAGNAVTGPLPAVSEGGSMLYCHTARPQLG